MSDMEGKIDEMKGRAKKAVGDLTDDDKLRDEGKADQAGGKAKQKIEQAKDKLEEGVDKATAKAKEKMRRSGG
jgi:uncharacterized protein YjbJ (UPF0337 family)